MNKFKKNIICPAMILILSTALTNLFAAPSLKQQVQTPYLTKQKTTPPSQKSNFTSTKSTKNTSSNYAIDDDYDTYESRLTALENIVIKMQLQITSLQKQLSNNESSHNNIKTMYSDSNLIEKLQEKNSDLKKEIEKRKKDINELARQENFNPKGAGQKKAAHQIAMRKANDQLNQNTMQIAELEATAQSRSTLLGRLSSKFFKKPNSTSKKPSMFLKLFNSK